MTQKTIRDMQADHHVWLNEIERWQGYLRTWRNEQPNLLQEFEKFQKRLAQYGNDLNGHAGALETHRSEIIACERAMVEQDQAGGQAEPELVEAHAKSVRHHEAQRSLHERLKQMHHTLLAQLGMLGHTPSIDE